MVVAYREKEKTMGRWIIAIIGAVIGALLTGFILSQLGVTGILYTILVLVGSAICSSLAGTLANRVNR